MNKATFFRKASNLEELERYTNSDEFQGDKANFKIFKEVEMSREFYKEFCKNFLEDRDFIRETTNESEWFEDNGEAVLKCILVKEKGQESGILVHSSGFDYARYTAIYKGDDNGKERNEA